MILKFKPLHPHFILPGYATSGAAAFDVRALDSGMVVPGQIAKIPLGFAVEIPKWHALLLTTRSSMGLNYGCGVPQGYGLIDSDYRGELSMVLRTEKPFTWQAGDRIGQCTLVPVVRANLILCEELGGTDRLGGFGSTGVK